MAASLENVYSAVFQTYTAAKSSPAKTRELSTTLHGSQLLVGKSSSHLQEVLSFVHDSLTKTKQRLKGLQLLKVIVSQCTTDVFQQNGERWLRLLTQILQGHSDVEVYRYSLQVLGDILEHAKNFTDVSRLIVNSTIPELMPVLLKPSSTKVVLDSITCINRCIQTYPGPLGPYRGKIEALVYAQLNSNTQSKAVYKCFALLNQCGPGGTRGIKHTESWSKQCTELLGSLEHILTSLYMGFETDKMDTNSIEDCLPLSRTSPDPLESNTTAWIKSRWTTLCGCLEALLGVQIQATVKIPVDRIVTLICRALAVNYKMVLHKPTNERMLLASYLTEIHQACFAVLEQLIVTCRKNLLPYAVVITGVLSQELLWSKTTNTGYNMTFGILREKVYNVMTTWLKVLDGCAAVNAESKTWVEQILHDCTPYTESFTLDTNQNKTTKQEDMPKKNKKKGYHEISQGISTQRKIHTDANCRLVQAGLEGLYWLITTSGPMLDNKSLQAVHSFVIKTLLNIQQTLQKKAPIPYSEPACRKALYRLLLACLINTHPHTPPPTQCAIRIFSNGQMDKHLEVSSFCLEALRICELVIHPRAPVLNGPIICQSVLRIGSDPEIANQSFEIDVDRVEHLKENSKRKETSTNLETANQSLEIDVDSAKHLEGNSKGQEMTNNQSALKRPFTDEDEIPETSKTKVLKMQSDDKERFSYVVFGKDNDKCTIDEMAFTTTSDEFHFSFPSPEKNEARREKLGDRDELSVGQKTRHMNVGDTKTLEGENKDDLIQIDSESSDDEALIVLDDKNVADNDNQDEEYDNDDDNVSGTSKNKGGIDPSNDGDGVSQTSKNKAENGSNKDHENLKGEDEDKEVNSDDGEDNSKETGAETKGEETEQNEEVATMMLAFVDASPDSD